MRPQQKVNRKCVLVAFNKEAGDAGRDIAMQIAAMNSLGVDADNITPKTKSEIVSANRNWRICLQR